jgi:2-methylisocitrate lyase-like PEP mutase family enzyme
MSYGADFRARLGAEPVPAMGIYDAFSATVASKHFNSLFVSGFGFAASHYGLPDIGFIAWPDVVSFVHRLRAVLPSHDLLVDIDDGYTDVDVAVQVVRELSRVGASGVVLEDQARPRRCGHFNGKRLLELPLYLEKLERVLRARGDMLVVARTDASEPEEIERRVQAFAELKPDVVLVDGVRDLGMLRRVAGLARLPLAFNQIAGGKSPPAGLSELRELGVRLVIYSTPCLFAALPAMNAALRHIAANDGRLPEDSPTVGEVAALLNQNLGPGDGR